MPITARLSKKFYDRLGDDVVGELVDLLNQVDTAARTELRGINESNFARFDAKLEQRAAEILAKVDTKFAEMDARFAKLCAEMDTRFAELRAEMDTRFAELRAEMDTRFAELRVEIHRSNAATKEGVLRWMIGLWLTQMLAFAGLWFSRA